MKTWPSRSCLPERLSIHTYRARSRQSTAGGLTKALQGDERKGGADIFDLAEGQKETKRQFCIKGGHDVLRERDILEEPPEAQIERNWAFGSEKGVQARWRILTLKRRS